jgi:hypothetical protein
MSSFNLYFTGGLEYTDDDEEQTVHVGGVEYLLTGRFKSMLRNAFIDWGTFLEIHGTNLDINSMFEEVVKLLNIEQDDTVKDSFLELVKVIYDLPIKAHMASMLKQFMLYEPVSAALHGVFTTIKHHFERVVEKYVQLRNQYIDAKDLSAKYKPNKWCDLLAKMEKLDDEKELQSSSVVLFFLNAPKYKSVAPHLDTDLPESEALVRAVAEFKYPGFCPKVPDKRLQGLLEFPLAEFITAIKKISEELGTSENFPDYEELENQISKKMEELPAKPADPEEVPRQELPAELQREGDVKELSSEKKIKIIKWYVDHILEMRKALIPLGEEYEKYYLKSASVMEDINNLLESKLR